MLRSWCGCGRRTRWLRALLGLDARPADGHAVAWSPTLLSNQAPRLAIDAHSSNAAKLELFRSLFGARSDVYAVRWENASTGKSGWSPATARRLVEPASVDERDYLPLTDDVLASHLRGEATIGIYPLLRGDTCTLLACDFDRGTLGARRARLPRRVPRARCARGAGTLPLRRRWPCLGLLRRRPSPRRRHGRSVRRCCARP